MHIHLVDFQILRRNGGPVFPYERDWKDVAYVGASETLELLMTFHEPEAIDPTQPTLGRFVMHCHNLVHEDHDMMNQFEIAPGAATTATTTPTTTQPGKKPVASPVMAPAMMVQWTLRA